MTGRDISIERAETRVLLVAPERAAMSVFKLRGVR